MEKKSRYSSLRRILSCAALFAVILSVTCPSARAVDPFDYDFALVDALNRLKMQQYALDQLNLMLERYPGRKPTVLIEKGRILALTGDWEKGKEIIQQIEPGSSRYAQAQLALADVAFQQGRADRARQLYEQFFDEHQRPVSASVQDRKAFRRAILNSAMLLDRAGKHEAAQQRRKLLKKFKQKKFKFNMRQITYMNAKAILNSQQEKYFKKEKQVDNRQVQLALNKMDSLKWEMDGIATASYVGRAQAHTLLDQPDEAISVLETAWEVIERTDKALRKEDQKAQSPMAGAYFFMGRAYKIKARQAAQSGEREKAKKLLIKSARYLLQVAKKYTASQLAAQSVLELEKIRTLLKNQFGAQMTVDLPRGKLMRMQALRAKTHFSDGNYEKALPVYMKAMRVAWQNPAVIEGNVAERVIFCLGKLERYLEAWAIADYLKDVFPEKKTEVATQFRRVGAFLYEAANAAADSRRKELFRGDAMQAWETFVELNPAHRQAAPTAYAIAEHHYSKAKDLEKELQRAKNEGIAEEKINKMNERLRTLFNQCIPRYQRVVDNFGTSHKAVRALYKLGWIHYSLGNNRKSAHAFTRYAKKESKSKYALDRYRAAFYAGITRMESQQPSKAIEHFRQIIDWSEKETPLKGLNAASDQVTDLRRDAFSMIGWCHDRMASQYQKEITALQDEVKRLQRRIGELETRLSKAKKDKQQAEAAQEKAKKTFEQQREQYTRPVPSIELYTKRALEGKNLEEMSEAARRKTRQNAEQQAGRELKKVLSDQRRALPGEIERSRKEINRLEKKVTEKKKTLDELKTSIKENEDKLQTLQEDKKMLAADLKSLSEQIQSAEKALEETKAQQQKLQQQLEKAKQENDNRKRMEIAQQQQKVRDELRDIRRRVSREAGQEEKKELEQLQKRLSRTVRRIEERKRSLTQSRARKKELQKEINLLEKQKLVAEGTLALKKAEKAYANAEVVEERKKLRTGMIAERKEKLADVLEKVKDAKIQLAVYRQNTASERIETFKPKIAELEAQIEKTRKEQIPIQKKRNALWRKELDQFETYVAKFPESKHAPKNLSRIGTLHIELGNYDEASKTLSRLTEKYPESEAADRALFDLGRAFVENKEMKQAADIFKRMCRKVHKVELTRLNYICRTMLQAGEWQLVAKAGEEILRRSKEKDIEAFVVENTRFRLGKAHYRMGNGDTCISVLEDLLSQNPKTGYYFDALLLMGRAYLEKDQPQLSQAKKKFAEVLKLAHEQPDARQEASLLLGKVYMKQGDKASLRRALVNFHSVVEFTQDDRPSAKKWVEVAMYRSVLVNKKLGEEERARKVAERYRNNYPNGQYLKKLEKAL